MFYFNFHNNFNVCESQVSDFCDYKYLYGLDIYHYAIVSISNKILTYVCMSQIEMHAYFLKCQTTLLTIPHTHTHTLCSQAQEVYHVFMSC